MKTGGMREALDRLRRALHEAGEAGLSDGQLLARFVATRAEADFAALVRRHGPMVLATCRRLLHHEQDAEDAFQATFLVLARKAASVRKRESIGPWLFGVARRTALEARSAIARRQARERQVEDMPHPEATTAEPQDWRPLLDEELSRLPEKYQAAVVLCDLEGRPRKEAARQLGVPEGTLSSRLAAARRLLAERLSRRGLALPGGALAAALCPTAASACVPAALVGETARAATLVAAGQLAAVSTPAAALARGVLKAMLMAKLKLAVGAVLAAAVALGAGGLAFRGGPAPVAAQGPRAAAPQKDELELLRKEVELLKLNLQVVLEKVKAQDAEIRALKGGKKAAKDKGTNDPFRMGGPGMGVGGFPGGPGMPPGGGIMGGPPGAGGFPGGPGLMRPPGMLGAPPGAGLGPVVPGEPGAPARPIEEAEAALRALRAAPNKAARDRAAATLEKALKKLRQPDGGRQ